MLLLLRQIARLFELVDLVVHQGAKMVRIMSRLWGWIHKMHRRYRRGLVMLVLLGLVVVGAGPVLSEGAIKATIKFVSPEWVVAQGNKVRVLDVRNAPLEYINSHLPGAVNIADGAFRGPDGFLPVQYWDNATLGKILAQSGVSNNSRVVVYSSGNDVLGATMVAYLLERLGGQEIYVLDGGYGGYRSANQPLTKVFPRYPMGNFKVQDHREVRVNVEEVRKLIGKPGVVFLDPRPGDLFRGDRLLWTRNGHIPGAINIPWQDFTEANSTQEDQKNPHKLKSLEDIRRILADRKIQKTNDVIVTCSTGREATLQYVVLKHLLGYPKVRIYEGSWTEYSTTNLPVAKGA
jgi:thiosulfate/3-mercaptopyruvate sulfurtransferase